MNRAFSSRAHFGIMLSCEVFVHISPDIILWDQQEGTVNSKMLFEVLSRESIKKRPKAQAVLLSPFDNTELSNP